LNLKGKKLKVVSVPRVKIRNFEQRKEKGDWGLLPLRHQNTKRDNGERFGEVILF